MNYAIQISDDKSDAIVIAENGGVCTITCDNSVCRVRMFQDKIEAEYNDDIWELLSQGRVYLKRFSGNEISYSMIEYCIEWLIPMDDFTEVDFDSLVLELNKRNAY